MTRIPDDGLLYHRSYVEVSIIDLSKCRNGLDFGKGFYLTSSLRQAVSFVPSQMRKAKSRGLIPETTQNADGRGSIFKFQPNPNLKIRFFDAPDAEWLHFVASNRSRALFPELCGKFETVDVVAGKIADDQTAMTLNNYVSGAFGEPGTERADRIAVELLEPNRLEDRFCFRTRKAISSLQFVRSVRYGDVR